MKDFTNDVMGEGIADLLGGFCSKTLLVGSGEQIPLRALEAALNENWIVMLLPRSLLARIGQEATSAGQAKDLGDSSCVVLGTLRIDTLDRRAFWGGVYLPLTEQELSILAVLARGFPVAVAHNQLSRVVWGIAYPASADCLRSAIKRLRRKLWIAGASLSIESVRGFGFRLRCES